jgi:hypothetical protein
LGSVGGPSTVQPRSEPQPQSRALPGPYGCSRLRCYSLFHSIPSPGGGGGGSGYGSAGDREGAGGSAPKAFKSVVRVVLTELALCNCCFSMVCKSNNYAIPNGFNYSVPQYRANGIVVASCVSVCPKKHLGSISLVICSSVVRYRYRRICARPITADDNEKHR